VSSERQANEINNGIDRMSPRIIQTLHYVCRIDLKMWPLTITVSINILQL